MSILVKGNDVRSGTKANVRYGRLRAARGESMGYEAHMTHKMSCRNVISIEHTARLSVVFIAFWIVLPFRAGKEEFHAV